jgi:outer membrane biosynthesis protein TonB
VFTLSELFQITAFKHAQDSLHSATMKQPLRLAIGISLVLHLLLIWGAFSSHSAQTRLAKTNTLITYVISPPEPPAPKPVAVNKVKQNNPQTLLPPPPEHNWDDPTTANRVKQKAREGKVRQAAQQGSQQAPTPADAEKPIESTTQESSTVPQMQVVSSTGDIKHSLAELQKAARLRAIFGQDVVLAKLDSTPNKKGDSLLDNQLEDAVVHSPYTEDEERVARWYDEVYQRLEEQVKTIWRQPKSHPHFRGEIRLDLNIDGRLQDAWIHLPSGDRTLDNSALQAIRSVPRYDLPHLAELARYYQHLRFTYQGEE